AAERIMLFYIDGLRQLIRRRKIESSTAAKTALEEEAHKSNDMLLQQRLYDLIASQMATIDEAKAQSDFAFKVIEPPFVADKPYKPKPTLYSAVALVLMPIFLVVLIRLREFAIITRQEARLRNQ